MESEPLAKRQRTNMPISPDALNFDEVFQQDLTDAEKSTDVDNENTDNENTDVHWMDEVSIEVSMVDIELIKSELALIKKTVEEELAKMHLNIKQMMCQQIQIFKRLVPQKNETKRQFAELPLKSYMKVIELEDRLQNFEYRDSLVNHLKSVGGTSGDKNGLIVMKAVLKSLISKELLKQFSFTGKDGRSTDGKYALKPLENIRSLLFDVVVLADANYSRQKCDHDVTYKVLKHINAAPRKKYVFLRHFE